MSPEDLAEMVRIREARFGGNVLELGPRAQQLERFVEAHFRHPRGGRYAGLRFELSAEGRPFKLMKIGQFLDAQWLV